MVDVVELVVVLDRVVAVRFGVVVDGREGTRIGPVVDVVNREVEVVPSAQMTTDSAGSGAFEATLSSSTEVSVAGGRGDTGAERTTVVVVVVRLVVVVVGRRVVVGRSEVVERCVVVGRFVVVERCVVVGRFVVVVVERRVVVGRSEVVERCVVVGRSEVVERGALVDGFELVERSALVVDPVEPVERGADAVSVEVDEAPGSMSDDDVDDSLAVVDDPAAVADVSGEGAVVVASPSFEPAVVEEDGFAGSAATSSSSSGTAAGPSMRIAGSIASRGVSTITVSTCSIGALRADTAIGTVTAPVTAKDALKVMIVLVIAPGAIRASTSRLSIIIHPHSDDG